MIVDLIEFVLRTTSIMFAVTIILVVKVYKGSL